MDHSDNLISMTQTGISLTEHEGIFQSKNFTATPCYGPGIEDPVLPSVIRVRDFGTHTSEYSDFGHFDLTFILLSGSPWDFADTLLSAGLKILDLTYISATMAIKMLQKNMPDI